MSATPPEAPEPAERPDRRGTPRGEGTITPEHGGRIGNPPFVPTEDQRQRVRTLAKTFPVHGEHFIARLVGISRDTLRRHFADDLELGRAEMLAGIGSQMINRALDADRTGDDGKPIAKGDLDAQKFILARLGGWTTKVEMSGKDGRPIETVDLSGMSVAALREYGRQAAIQNGLDPDEAVGPAIDD